jgi:hypothetical protein
VNLPRISLAGIGTNTAIGSKPLAVHANGAFCLVSEQNIAALFSFLDDARGDASAAGEQQSNEQQSENGRMRNGSSIQLSGELRQPRQ